MSTISCSYDEFKAMAKEFFHAIPNATQEQLDAGLNCLGLAYLGIQWTNSKIDEVHRMVGAPTVLKLAMEKALEREVELEYPKKRPRDRL